MGDSYREAACKLLSYADIEVDGPNPWDIEVTDQRFFRRLMRDGSLGLGESYMDGWWQCRELDQFFHRILKSDLPEIFKKNKKFLWLSIRANIFNHQSGKKTYEVGEKHYDLGNDIYTAMLDSRMNYTCGYWKNAGDLKQAQEDKLELICRKLGLTAGMKVLELGCGWGSFAKYAAEKYGAKVLGVTVSKEQVELGMEMCKGLPVELRLQDYREVCGKFDRVVSIGIMEHVGYKNYPDYMQTTKRCLREDGLAFIHTIGSNRARKCTDPWIDKYIFPNGVLPSIAQLAQHIEGLFVVEDWHNFGPSYDKTLMAWWHNFNNAWDSLKDQYDERFYRMWKYYLQSCAGGFRARFLQLWQIVMTHPGQSQPDCRFS